MERLLLTLLAVTAGGLVAAQAPVNARLRLMVGSPWLAAAVSFAVGTVILVVLAAAAPGRDGVARLGGGPWWAYLGGACGVVMVLATLSASPRLGVTPTFVAVVAGQVALAALIDRFGWFGAAVRPVGTGRLVALGLLVVSLVLLLRE
jgi:transporter family-2 protein